MAVPKGASVWVAVALMGGLAWWALRPQPQGTPPPPGAAASAVTPVPSAETATAAAVAVTTAAAAVQPMPSARLALVIDDWGYQKAPVERLKTVRYQVTTSILPNLPFSRAAAQASHDGGHEVILHCPMQSVKSIARERNTLLTSMTPDQARAALAADWDSVPYLVGMNNHEGSKASADRALMDVAAGFLKGKGAFFLDSVTTNRSAIPAAARAAGVPWAARRVFLDNQETDAAIARAFREAVRLAKKNGQCIAIGHPHQVTLDVLERLTPGLQAEGVTLVKVSDLVHP